VEHVEVKDTMEVIKDKIGGGDKSVNLRGKGIDSSRPATSKKR
jgi:hypothetical protein